jgi:hypothetical protein
LAEAMTPIFPAAGKAFVAVVAVAVVACSAMAT